MKHVEIDEILAPGDAAMNRERESRVRRDFWTTVRRAVRHVPFIEDVVAGYYCALDTKTPLRAKGILLAALAYFVLPFDVVPDFLLGVGFTDDIAVLTAAITTIGKHITPEHRKAALTALARL